MARYPAALWKPIEMRFLSGDRMAVYNRVNLHVAVSEGASLHNYFNAPGRASSHFYIRKDGTVEQYVDTAYQGEADLDGNDATISVETQGGVRNAQGEPWTDAQVSAIVQLLVWAHRTHGIPLTQARSSKPGAESKGVSWHRLGCDGNFPALGILAGRRQLGGGMRYSKSAGKICPGDAKIMQIPSIIALAGALAGGVVPVSNPVTNVAPAPVLAPAPAPLRPARNVAMTAATQRALRVTQDGFWGDDTELALTLVRSAINGRFPAGVKAAQRVVGTAQDGAWGPKSRAALKSTIASLQHAWGASSDGIWGNQTEAAMIAAYRRNYKNW